MVQDSLQRIFFCFEPSSELIELSGLEKKMKTEQLYIPVKYSWCKLFQNYAKIRLHLTSPRPLMSGQSSCLLERVISRQF